jgi:hypothetical protein
MVSFSFFYWLLVDLYQSMGISVSFSIEVEQEMEDSEQ